jgi:putative pyrroloquinoline-quinone binding quinoprotein
MSDFTARLGAELREAALHEERRGPVVRALRAARPEPAPAVRAVAAAAVAGVLLIAVVLLGSPAPEPASPPGPRVAADVAVGDALGASARPGFGAMWLSDSSRGEILRVDPGTLRVTRRIPVGSEVALATAGGSVWALPRGPGYQGGPILRIAPDSGRTVARIVPRTPAGGPFRGGSLVVAGGRVWVLGPTGAVAVDPASNGIVAEIRLGGSFTVTDAVVREGELWLTRADRSITRFDARSGRRLGRLPWRTDGFLAPFAGRLVEVTKDSVALVDPATGRPQWRRRVGTELRDGQVSGTRVFVVGADGPAAARDRLWQIDARSGRIEGAITVPQFGPLGVVAVGDGVWLLAAGGHAVVVEP